MAYVMSDDDYGRLVEDLVKRLSTPESPDDLDDQIKLTMALAAGVYPQAAALDRCFDWHEAPPVHREARG